MAGLGKYRRDGEAYVKIRLLDGDIHFASPTDVKHVIPYQVNDPVQFINYDYPFTKLNHQHGRVVRIGSDNDNSPWVRVEREEGSYFLSYDELLLLCDVLQRNCIVFGAYDTLASFRGCTLCHAGVVPSLVAIHEGLHAQQRCLVCSHFQRMILRSDWQHLLEEPDGSGAETTDDGEPS